MTDKLQPTLEADFTFAEDRPLLLTAGGCLQPVTLRYSLYGRLNSRRDNVILACHALSGTSRVADWWSPLFGPDRPFDLKHHCVLGINMLGSCYGSTGPRSLDPSTGRPYGSRFPLLSVLDMVHAQAQLVDHLGIDRLHAVVGGSIGGMQALAWAIHYPERVPRCICVGAAPLSAMGLALNHLQRKAILNDPCFQGGDYTEENPPVQGLALARALAMCSYKSPQLFEERYGRRPNRSGEQPEQDLRGRYDGAGYLDYQGQSFPRRFDANSYLIITRAMDNFDLAKTLEGETAALERIRARMLFVGISSDWLFPPSDVQALAERMRMANREVQYREQISSHGHDAFLADADQLAPLIADVIHEGIGACV
jgi:homoserine O-acetyltransferase/O-succinyltransferase